MLSIVSVLVIDRVSYEAMDTSEHTLENLFTQLGLRSSQEQIDLFIKTHSLSQDESLDDAVFWTPHQAKFIQECWLDDADWVEVVDRLDALLHKM